VQIDRRTNQVTKAIEKTSQRWGKTSKTISNNYYSDEEKHIQTPEICEGYTGPTQCVIVASVKGQAAKKGIKVGYVVTHVNGERWEGSAADLLHHIQYFAERGDDTLTLVFNAEHAIATALSKSIFAR
jgi:S1-C subfamily serine protease